MGPVFRGEDGETRQRVVIKVIRVGLTPDQVTRVASALAALRHGWPAHPGLVPLLDTGVVDVEPYVVTPWVDGDSLDVALREYGPAHLTDALPRLRRLAEALDTAAEAGIAHGSLHLRDVIVSVEQTVVTGLGVAQVLERIGVRPPVRRPYCAPEVAAGGPISEAADQYALAAIAGEWLSGRRVPAGGAALKLPAATPEGAEALSGIVARGLSDEPDARFPSCTALVDALTERLGDAAPRPSRSAVRRAVTADAPRLLFDEAAPDADTGRDPVLDIGPPVVAVTLPVRSETRDAMVLGEIEAPDVDAASDSDRQPVHDVDLAGGATMTLATDDQRFDADWDPASPEVATSGPQSLDDDDHDEHVDDEDHAESLVGDDDAVEDAAAAFDAPALDRPEIVYADTARADWSSTTESTPAMSFDDEPAAEFASDPEPAHDTAPVRDNEPTSVATWAGLIVLLTLGALAGGWMLLRWGTPSAPQMATSTPASAPVATPPVTPPTNAVRPPEEASAPATPAAPAARDAEAPSAAAPTPATDAAAQTPPATTARATQPPAPARAAPPPRPETKKPSPAARPPAAPPGRLLVRTTPAGAEVFINGERRGVTPLTLRGLALGTYTLRLVHGGYTPAEQRVVLNAGRPARSLDVSLARVRSAAAPRPPARPVAPAAATSAATDPGSLLVDSRPGGARVFVDGREVGVTPVTVPALAVGTHAVRIERAGFAPIATTARIEARTRARIAVTLTAERPR